MKQYPPPGLNPLDTTVKTPTSQSPVTRLREPSVNTSIAWAELDHRFHSPKPVRLSPSRRLQGPPRPRRETLPTFLNPPPLRSLSLNTREDPLPSLRQALAERSVEARHQTWWTPDQAQQQLAKRLVPLRLLGSGVAAAVVGVFAFQAFTLNGTQLASAPNLTDSFSAPDRNSPAFVEASRSFLRTSVSTPSTAAPTTTLPPPTTQPPRPTTTVPRRVAPSVPATTSSCSKSRSAARDCWWGLISQYDWDDEYAFNVMWCESTGNPNAKNSRSTATGLFQILNGPYDPEANVRLAHQMYSKRGWQPWVCKG